jgi:transcriptional regulator with XRE-family HTH domain
MLDKLAEELKEARKKTGLSLLQISAKSKIDLKFLEAMEKGNFSFLPEIYVKAFIKDFANIINLDPEVMLKKYDAYKMGRNYGEVKQPEPVPPPVSEVKSPESPVTESVPAKELSREKNSAGDHGKKKVFQTRKKEKAAGPAHYSPGPTFDAVAKKTAPSDLNDEKKKKNLILGLAAAGAVVLILLMYFLFFSKETEIVVKERPIEEVIKQNKERFSEPEIPKTEQQPSVLPAEDSLSLLIKANDTSWVKIILDDSDEEEFILFPQSQKIIKTKNNYKITFGNYSRIELFLNNKPLDRGNNMKSVVHVLIDSTGLKYLNAPPVIQ